jgi:hypothetical protein
MASGVISLLGFWGWSFNLFLQNGRNQVFGALLGEEALGLLAFCFVKIVWILARIPVPIFTANNKQQAHSKQSADSQPLDKVKGIHFPFKAPAPIESMAFH